MVKVTGNQLLLKMGRATLGTSLIEGQFPKYQDVIPQDCDRHVELKTAEFHGALKQAALLTNEESKGVRISFAEGGITLSSRAPEQGEATISLPVDYKGEPIEMGFNPVFLTDVLRVTHEEQIRFEFKEASRPGVIRLSDDFVHVVMPVNLSSA
jgi:DNA polymerase-3 subunit beta